LVGLDTDRAAAYHSADRAGNAGGGPNRIMPEVGERACRQNQCDQYGKKGRNGKTPQLLGLATGFRDH